MKASISMGLRAVENYNSEFTLPPQVEEVLVAYLKQPRFSAEIAKVAKCESSEFADILFQPVPFSKNTPRGMPKKYEWYLENPRYTIINVPPTFMFKAKCFKPSRLCAVFRRLGVPEEELSFGDMKQAEKAQLREKREKEISGDGSEEDPWKGIGNTIQEVFNERDVHDDDDLDQYMV